MNWHATFQSLAAVAIVSSFVFLMGAAFMSMDGLKRTALAYAVLAIIAATAASFFLGLGIPA